MITVIGLGFVGLTTALSFCEKGFKVFGYDINKELIKELEKFNVPFFEPHLDKKLKNSLNINFYLNQNLTYAIQNSSVVFVCVGTPSDSEGDADLTSINEVIKSIINCLHTNDSPITITIKSTVPPSTTKNKIKPLLENHGYKVGKNVGLANNPEFLREGFAWEDVSQPDRIVIGAEDEISKCALNDIYLKYDTKVHFVSLNTGEYIKYLSNTLLSTLISYSNDMSMIGYSIGDIEIASAFKILHEDKRWFGSPANMKSYAYPGCGFGGYCLPKDTSALYSQSKVNGYESEILKGVINVNKQIKKFLVEKCISQINKNDYIAILGLSFKPKSDDVRDTPANDIISIFLDYGYSKLIAYDPIATDNFKRLYNHNIEYVYSIEDALKKAENIVIVTAWEEFKDKKMLYDGKKVFDFRYCL